MTGPDELQEAIYERLMAGAHVAEIITELLDAHVKELEAERDKYRDSYAEALEDLKRHGVRMSDLRRAEAHVKEQDERIERLEELHNAVLGKREASERFRALVSSHDPFSPEVTDAGDVVFAAANRVTNALNALTADEEGEP